jgi:hypothetical protein
VTKLKLFSIIFFVIAFAGFASALPVGAQTYSFNVESQVIDVFWESNGSLSLNYLIVFNNSASADPIDFVDIGFPTNSYRLNNVSATIDGRPITNIEDSPYVTYGVALGLGPDAIPPGQRGTVFLQVTNIEDVLYVDDEDSTYASAVFSPNYFGSEFASGSTDFTLIYHLPPGVAPEEPKWHDAPGGFPESPLTGFDDQGRITYTWQNTNASASQFYLFGASFPQSYVPIDSIGVASDFTSVDGSSSSNFEFIFPLLVFSCICLAFVIFIWAIVAADRRRKLQYLPPKIAIEGNGIKRGLTAPEAALLLEQPMDKILTMILFSVIKKGAAKVTKKDPLKLDIEETLPENLHEYETVFLDAFKETHKTKRRKALQKLMVRLVKSVANKMKGFSKRETTVFYKQIVEEAWLQVEKGETPEVKSDKYQEELEWTMMDKDYEKRTQRTFNGPVIMPTWWNHYDPVAGQSPNISPTGRGASVPNVSTSSGAPSLPTLPGGDFAASLVTGVQNMSAGVLGSLNDFTGGVTKVTNPPPKPSSTGRSTGGWKGGGSSCACACAGCACACAGGGR